MLLSLLCPSRKSKIKNHFRTLYLGSVVLLIFGACQYAIFFNDQLNRLAVSEKSVVLIMIYLYAFMEIDRSGSGWIRLRRRKQKTLFSALSWLCFVPLTTAEH